MADICFFMLSNGFVAAICAILLCGAVRWFRKLHRPALLHLLWVLVLLRLVAPPMLQIDVSPVTDWVGNRLQHQAEQPVHILHFSVTKSEKLLRHTIKSVLAPQKLLATDPLPDINCFTVTRLQLDSSLLKVALEKVRFAKSMLVLVSKRFLFPVWILGALVCVVSQLLSVYLFARRVKQETYSSGIWQRRAERVAKKMGFDSCPKFLLVRAKISPMLWGFGSKTRILFPERLLESLTIRQQDTLIAHELAHYRRGDQWVRLLELIGMVVFWWHPIFWLARHEIERSEEVCCDAWAVRQANGCPRTYASALLATVDFLSVGYVPPVASAVGRVEFLRERLHAIMLAPLEQRRNLLPDAYPGILALAVLILVPTPVLRSHQAGSGLASAASSQATAISAESRTNIDAQLGFSRSESDFGRSGLQFPLRSEGDAKPGDGSLAVDLREAIQLRVNSTNRAMLCNTITGQSLDLGVGRIASASFSSDGARVAIGFNDGSVELIDCRTLQILSAWRIGSSRVTSVALSPNGQTLAAGSANGRFQLVRFESDEDQMSRENVVVRRMQGARVQSVSFAKNGQSLAVIWQTAAGSRAELVQVQSGATTSTASFDRPLEVVFDDVVSRTSPPLWRFATREGKLFSFEDDELKRLTGIDVSDAELRSYRIPHRP